MISCLAHRNYEDDFEPEDEDEVREEMLRLADAPAQRPANSSPATAATNPAPANNASDDIYDFSNTSNMGY